MGIEIESNGRFGNAMHEALVKNEMSLRDLAIKTEGTYEHLRKLLKGIAWPSRLLLKEICKVLKRDFEEMETLVAADKMQHKFGKNAHAVFGRNPRMQKIEPLLDYLTDDQFESFVTQMSAVSRQNRKNG